MENITFRQKMMCFFRKYGYYLLLGLLASAVAIVLFVVAFTDNNSDEGLDPVSGMVTPYMPVLNATLYKDYYGDELVYNETLRQWETHNGIDLQVASGSSVYSILDGKVIDVYSNILEGTVVVVEHDDGLKSCYGSLDEDVDVEIGDDVSRGDELGSVSSSATAESDAGAHLHFAMFENNEKINPTEFLNISTK